jgi:hypothetical protein
MSTQITRQLTRHALTMALGRRRPPSGLLHHSDRGSQYASGDYRRLLKSHGMVCSMSRRGNCWDNAVAESFFATLKVELGVHDTPWPTRAHAQGEVFEYIEAFYNGQRRHSTLAYLSPVAFERQWAAARGTPSAASRPIAGRSPQLASSIGAPGATRTRGVAISVSPQSLWLEPITRGAGTLEVGALISSAPQRSAP